MAPPRKPRAPASAANAPSRHVLRKHGLGADADVSPTTTPKKRSKTLSATPDGTGVKVEMAVASEALRRSPIKPAQLPAGFTEAQVLKTLHGALADLAEERVTTSKLLGRFWERLLPFVDVVQRDAHLVLGESLDMLDWAMTKTVKVMGAASSTPLETRLMNAAGGFTALTARARADIGAAARALLEVDSLMPLIVGKAPGRLAATRVKLPPGVKLTYADSWKIGGESFKDAVVLLEVGPYKVMLLSLEAKTRHSGGGVAQAQTLFVRLAAAAADAELSYLVDGKRVSIAPDDLLVNHVWLSANLVVREAGQASTKFEMPRPGSRSLRKRIASQANKVGEDAAKALGLKDLVVPAVKTDAKTELRGMREVCYAVVEAARRQGKARTRSR